MRISLIGSGNVAAALGQRMLHAGHIIHQVYSRNLKHASELAEKLSATATDNFNDHDNSADIYIVAITDSALKDIGQWLKLGDRLVVHTAGSVSINVLQQVSTNYGVLYPLQTFKKQINADAQIPILIDANNPWNKAKLAAFAQSFASSVTHAGDDERKHLHLAAVFTHNFSNLLYTLAESYCNNEGVDFKLIMPLLEESVKRLAFDSPANLQTGPAARKDEPTMHEHREMLKKYPQMLRVYNLLSESIQNYS